MAHKLTKRERAAIDALTRTLGQALPPQQRSKAPGIASGLVRLRSDSPSADDVRSVLDRYGADDEALAAAVSAGVLSPARDGSGYSLSLPDEGADGASADGDDGRGDADKPGRAGDGAAPGGDAGAGQARPKAPAREGALARQGTRSLSHLTCVRKQTPEANEVRLQVVKLDPRLWINGWLLSTPDAFLRFEREVRAIDAALADGTLPGDGTLSLRELSYKVFGDEKFLAIEGDGRRLLQLMGLPMDVVAHRPQPKMDLLHFVPKRRRRLRLVVSENLDPWYNVRNALYLDGRKRVLGERVHGAVFGNGSLAGDTRRLFDLLDTLGAEEVELLYWGDLDRAGLEILGNLARAAEDVSAEGGLAVSVEPLAAAYRLMLRRARRRFPDPLGNEGTLQANIDVPEAGLALLEGVLDKDDAAYLRGVLEGARLVPQEILTAGDL